MYLLDKILNNKQDCYNNEFKCISPLDGKI